MTIIMLVFISYKLLNHNLPVNCKDVFLPLKSNLHHYVSGIQLNFVANYPIISGIRYPVEIAIRYIPIYLCKKFH